MGFGSNLAVAHTDSLRGRDALAALDFYVHCDLFENPSSRFADILLPVNTFHERDALRVGFTSGKAAEEHIQYRPGLVAPFGGARSDAEIAVAIASELGRRDQFFGGSIKAGRAHVCSRSVCRSTSSKAGRAASISPWSSSIANMRRLRRAASPASRPRQVWSNSTARSCDVWANRVPAFAEADLPGNDTFPLALTTAKTVYFCHSQHRNVPSLRKREPEPLVYLSPMTASDLCLSEGDWAKVTASEGWIRLRVRHDKSLHPKVVRASYGWWQANAPLQLPGFDPFTGGANYNMLTGAKRLDRMSVSAPMRSLSCRVEPISQAPNSG